MKKGFSKNIVILSSFSIISKIFGALYRVPLINILGAEGMGMYQLIYSIYALILSFNSGVSISVAKMTAGDNAKNMVKYTSFLVVFITLISSALLIVFRDRIAIFQGNEDIKNGYFFIIPTLFFVGILNVFRGWFQGKYNVKPTAISEGLESVFRLIFGLSLSVFLIKRGVIFGVYGALLGLLISEFIALSYIFIAYILNKNKDVNLSISDDKIITKKQIIGGTLKYVVSGSILPFSNFIDGILIVNLLKHVNIDNGTSIYGIFTGTVQSIVNMPAVFIMALITSVTPYISKAYHDMEIKRILYFKEQAVKLTVFVGLPFSILVFVFSKEIISFLYPVLNRSLLDVASTILMVSSFTILFNGLRDIFSAILLSFGYTKKTTINNIFLVILKELSLVYFIIRFGILGIGLAFLLFSFFGFLLNSSNVIFMLGKNLKLVKNISKICVSGVIMFFVAYLLNFTFKNAILGLFLGGILSMLLYLGILVAFGFFRQDKRTAKTFGSY